MTSDSYIVDSAATHDVVPRIRADFWAGLVDSYHCRMSYEYRRRDDFHGNTVRQRTDSYQVVGWKSDEAWYRRTDRGIRADPDHDYRLLFPTAGTMLLRQCHRHSRLQPGSAALTAMSQPFDLWQGTGTQAFIMTIPRREIDHRLNRSAPVAAQLDLTSGLGRVVGDITRGLFQERQTLTRRQFNAVSDRLVELLCMLVLGDNRPPAGDHLADVEAAARRYVREHADDPDLDGRAVAHALGWSLRQVQLALQRAGTTPRELIKEERLKLARERLQSPAYQRRTITDLAYMLGFSSVGAFSTAFRERYGHRPSDSRDG